MPAKADAAPGARRRALVTGASAGIGEEFVRQLAAGGYDLVLVARRKERLDQLAADVTQKSGVNVEVLPADLSTVEGVAAVRGRIAAGDIDLLVNNAGFATLGVFGALPLEREREELDVNICALVSLTHAALGPMLERGRGTIINLGSVGSFTPTPYMATYVATKAFVLHFSESVHEEVRHRGVTVTCLCPGFVATEFQAVAGLDASELPTVGRQTPAQVVAAALKGAAAGRAIVVPGAMNSVMAASPRFTPRFLVRRIAGSIFKKNATKADPK
jgi:hypothetical protein